MNGDELRIFDQAAESLGQWLTKETCIVLIDELLMKYRLSSTALDQRFLGSPERFMVSYLGYDLLRKKEVRQRLVFALMTREGRVGLETLFKRYNRFKPIPENDSELQREVAIQSWTAGSIRAKVFTQFFGLPMEFAGTKSKTESIIPFEEVEADKTWFELHDYQRRILFKLQTWLGSPTSSRTAIMVLPTGTGKTRVAVRLILDTIKNIFEEQGTLRWNFLWIAHTQELCEQAVDSFKETWANEGKQGCILPVRRFWGDVDTSSLYGLGGVTVAGIQKLNQTLKNEENCLILEDTLKRNLQLIIIDEAHLADNPSYLNVLSFFDDEDAFDPEIKKGWKLLGLTATPFKSDEKRSRRLDKVFPTHIALSKSDEDLLEGISAEGVYNWMQKKEYMANDRYMPFVPPKASAYQFTDWEKDHYRNFEELTDTFLVRVSLDMERNNDLVKRLQDAVRNEGSRKILLFACSVPHCYILTYMLREMGIESTFVIGAMSKQERSERIRAFKSHKSDSPMVLINYAILTTGFDDPKIDTVFIARPTTSRVLYHQMIGRGLRGRKNGGSDDSKCLIIDVRDNFESFDGFKGVVNYMEEKKWWQEGHSPNT